MPNLLSERFHHAALYSPLLDHQRQLFPLRQARQKRPQFVIRQPWRIRGCEQ